MLALSLAHDGKKSQQKQSLRYLLYKWRSHFGSSYTETLATPLDVILRDIEYINIEEEVRAKHNA